MIALTRGGASSLVCVHVERLCCIALEERCAQSLEELPGKARPGRWVSEEILSEKQGH